MNALRKASWSPYAAGVGIGMLSWFAFLSADHPIGVSTAFEQTAAASYRAAAPATAAGNTWFATNSVRIDWEVMLVVGVFIGAAISAALGRDREPITVPAMWARRFGPSRAGRLIAAFAAGAVMIFGARMARGCTSGHGISGALQFAASSWVFITVMFATAILTAKAMYGSQPQEQEASGHV